MTMTNKHYPVARRVFPYCPKCHKQIRMQIDHDYCSSCGAVYDHINNMPERGFEPLPDYDGKVLLPKRQTYYSAGYDIHACLEQPVEIQPGQTVMISTGLTAFMATDEFLGLFVRSGIAAENQMTLQNGEGIIDSDYYGKHIKVLLRNEGQTVFTVNNGDRIAQAIFQKFLLASNDVPVFQERQDGFGHTSKKEG